MKGILILLSTYLLFSNIFASEKSVGQTFLNNYCISCHDNDLAEGDISFEDMAKVSKENLEVWKFSLSQVIGHTMPPQKKKKQPTVSEIGELKDWLENKFHKVLKDSGGFHDFKHPSKGNYVNHDLLFNEPLNDLKPAYTPSRIWRIHPEALLVRYNDLAHFMPKPNPEFPGQLANGDALVMSHASNNMGTRVLTLGADHIIGVQDGSGWWSKLPNIAPTLSLETIHDLKNYANMYGISNAEVEQLSYSARTLLKYLIKGPQVDQNLYKDPNVTKLNKIKTEKEAKAAGGFFYIKDFDRKYNPFKGLIAQDTPPHQKQLDTIVKFLFEKLLMRLPSTIELEQYSKIIVTQIKAL